jgi:aspartate/methionine/tyrosine aminotransferase
MYASRINLFEWLLQNAPSATYNLASNNITGVTVEEYEALTQYSFPSNFDYGLNAQYGADELKRVLCQMYKCPPENIVTTTGASEANFLVFASHLNQGDEFIVEQPGYPPMWLTPEMFGARRINWPRKFENKFSVDIEALQNLITEKTKLIALTNIHNPSGVLTYQKGIKAIAEVAEDHDVYVLVDEIYLDGSFVPQPSSFGLPNVIVTSSATKIYGLGGFHSGWIIAPLEVAAHCQRMKAHSTGAASYTSEIMTARILSTAHAQLLNRFQKTAKTNFQYLSKWMDHQKEFFEWVVPDGGIVCFPRYTMKISSVDLCTFLFDTQKILLNPGSYFGQEGCIRLSFGCDLNVLQRALDALEKCLQKLKYHR